MINNKDLLPYLVCHAELALRDTTGTYSASAATTTRRRIGFTSTTCSSRCSSPSTAATCSCRTSTSRYVVASACCETTCSRWARSPRSPTTSRSGRPPAATISVPARRRTSAAAGATRARWWRRRCVDVRRRGTETDRAARAVYWIMISSRVYITHLVQLVLLRELYWFDLRASPRQIYNDRLYNKSKCRTQQIHNIRYVKNCRTTKSTTERTNGVWA